jgi:hypothetical protein
MANVEKLKQAARAAGGTFIPAHAQGIIGRIELPGGLSWTIDDEGMIERIIMEILQIQKAKNKKK